MTQHSNANSEASKGKPTGDQRGGAGLKDVNRAESEDQAIEEKYLDEQGNPDDQVKVRHENRNTDKGRE